MTQSTTQRYHVEVTAIIGVYVDADSGEEAEERGMRVARARPRIQTHEVKRATAVPLTTEQQMSQDNLRIWQETEALKLGVFSQRQRWEVGALPEGELLLIAREELFKPFALIPRRSRKGPTVVRHAGTIRACITGGDPMAWSMEDDPGLNDEQWTSLHRLLNACDEVRRHQWMRPLPPEMVRVAIRGHRGTCQRCNRSTMEIGALVDIEWAGRLLSREYVL